MPSRTCLLAAAVLTVSLRGGAETPPLPARGATVTWPAFSLDHPAGPSFREEAKQTQRVAGSNVVPRVRAAWDAGADAVRIPPGDYRFGRGRWGSDGMIYPLEFADLRRDEARPFTIDASGATFWFDLPDDQAPATHGCVGFRNCAHVVFRGATIDRGTRGHVEGRITKIHFESLRFELAVSPGVTVPTNFSGSLEQRIVPFKADGSFCAPLYALQSGGRRLKYVSITPGTAPGHWWVQMADRALFDLIRDPAWIAAHGELGVLRVGDGISCIYTVTRALSLVNCDRMTMQDLRVHAAKGFMSEVGGRGAHLWTNCYFGPRPGTSQWQGGDGFMFNATRRGATLDRVTIRNTTDDAVNFHGYWSRVESADGVRLTVEPGEGGHPARPADVAPGDRLLFLDRATGRPLGDAVLVSAAGRTLTLDRPVAAPAGALIEWPEHECAGWAIRNCDWRDVYQRILIQSGPGEIRNCIFTRFGSGVELNSVFPYVEGGIPRDITVVDNAFIDFGPMPAGDAIGCYLRPYGPPEAPLLRGVAIERNTFRNYGRAAVSLEWAEQCVIRGNRFGPSRLGPPILLSNVQTADVRGNLVDNAGLGAGWTGSVLRLQGKCSGVELDGKSAEGNRK